MICGSKILVVDHPARWSDTPHYCIGALRREIEKVIVVGSLEEGQRRWFTAQARNYHAQFGRTYIPDRDLSHLRLRAAGINETLKLHPDADAVVIFHPPDGAFLKTDRPIAIIHDATWKQLTSTYPEYSQNDLRDETYRSGFTAERMAFDKARWLFFMSKWAADSACREYRLLIPRIHVVYPGANLPDVPENSAVQQSIGRRSAGQCRLLFVGYAGYRKGIDIAIKTVGCLRSLGIDATLHVVGATAEHTDAGNTVQWHGLLSKFVSTEFAQLSRLYLESFVLLLPSRAECAGIVLCEAAAFGVPAIVPQVGGMPELVMHGKTGYVLASGAAPAEYAQAIARLWSDPAGYRELCENARARYHELLNWDQSVRRMKQLLYVDR